MTKPALATAAGPRACQTHAEEMILPARYAKVIRSMAGPGGGPAMMAGADGGTGVPSGGNLHANFHLVDEAGVRKLVRDHQGVFVGAFQEAQRNGVGAWTKPGRKS